MSFTVTEWDEDWLTVVTHDDDGCRLAVIDRDSEAVEIIETNPRDEIKRNVVLNDVEEIRGVIEALEGSLGDA